MNAYTKSELIEMWKRPVEMQYQIAIAKMLEAINHTNGDITLCYSGGKDSTLMLDLYCDVVRLTKYKDKPIKVAFANTTNETRAMLDFVRYFIPYTEKKYGIKIEMNEVRPDNNLSWAKFVKEKGIPLISKMQAKHIRTVKKDALRIGCDLKTLEKLYMTGEKGVKELFDMGFSETSVLNLTGYVSSKDKFGKQFLLSKKWLPMVYCETDLTEQCCINIKEKPLKKITKGNIMTGEQAAESASREAHYLKTGCNTRMPDGTYKSKPFGAMTNDGILYTCKEREIPLCSDYGEIIREDDHYKCTKAQRTGCALCGFGCQYDTERFVRLADTEPQKVAFAFKAKEKGGAGYREAIEYMNEYCNTKVIIPT